MVNRQCRDYKQNHFPFENLGGNLSILLSFFLFFQVIDAQNGIQAKSSTVGSSQSIAKEVEMKDEASFQHSQDSQKQSSPTLNRINL